MPGTRAPPVEASAGPEEVKEILLSEPEKVGVSVKLMPSTLSGIPPELIVSPALAPSLKFALNEFNVCGVPGVTSSYARLAEPLELLVLIDALFPASDRGAVVFCAENPKLIWVKRAPCW